MPDGRIQAIIFDMDGVLIDARDWHYEALNRALKLFGYTISRFEHLVTYDGLPTRAKLKMLTKERELPEGIHDFIDEMKQVYTMETVYSKCKPIFCHQYALAGLAKQGYALCMASNSVRRSVEVMAERSGLKDYFSFMLSNQDVEKPKPDPEIYDTAIRRLGLVPEACMIVEDNENGIKSARASGAHVMVVRSTTEVNLENIEDHLHRFNHSEAS